MNPNIQSFLSECRTKFQSDLIRLDPAELKTYGRDWTKVYDPHPCAVAFPRTTQEVADLLKLCSKHQIAVVPSGGRTGLAGGAVAAKGELVLSLEKLNRMDPVDTLAHTVRVQAGAVTEAVHHHCAQSGLTWPVDFASKGSSQVGGNIATNAGGVKVIRYGLTRQWVLGLQVVTMDGEILELNGALEKNNTGLDLRQLFIGSEGTLGVITEATLKLSRLVEDLDVFFFGVSDISAVLNLFQAARRAPFTVTAYEFLTENCFESVVESRGLPLPFQEKYPAYVLLETEKPSHPDGASQLESWLESLFIENLVLNGTLAQSPQEARNLWSIREGITEALVQKGFFHKNDIALPISQLKEFVPSLYQLFSSRNTRLGIQEPLEVYLFGHIGDGNLHVNTMKPDGMGKDEFIKLCEVLDEELFALVKWHKGSISAEHGIGLLKKHALHFSRSSAEIELLKRIKKVLDPMGLLNPGKILD